MGKSTGLAQAQLDALGRIASVEGAGEFYLAGGTALALHLRHRRSLDLDLFSLRPGADLAAFRRALERALPDFEVRSISDVALKAALPGTLIDIVAYPYPPLEPPEPGPGGVLVARLGDLAAMKVAAVAQRGIRRDFWDLHAIAGSGFTLEWAIGEFQRRFRKKEGDLYHVLRSLTYFDDAERDPLFPAGLDEAGWRSIKDYFLAEAPSLMKHFVGP